VYRPGNGYFEEDVISTRIRLGDLLIEANLVSEADVTKALDRLTESGGRLGDSLVAIGAIDQRVLDAFLSRIPTEPADIKATGIEELDLMELLLKLIYSGRLETSREFAGAIKLPYHIVAELVQMAVDRMLLRTLGMRDSNSPLDMVYAFTEEGKRWTLDALERLRYVGPAPVALNDFSRRVYLQKLTNELVTYERILAGLGDLTFESSIIEQCGPALNSGRAMLLYGPPGNGKTSVAHALGSIFNDVIYVPYAIAVEGQIIRYHDPSIHIPINTTQKRDEVEQSFVRAADFDMRWVPCRRPFVVTGGELTLEMLDLRYDTTGHFYEAPLHVKALGGCFIIDDFGRQIVSPRNLLNRWIVPLEGRVDYLNLHTGKSFIIPFEELVIFSTNLEPEDLMDPAFLRRLPYKIEIGAPSLDIYKRIFQKECAKKEIELSDDTFNLIAYKVRKERGLDLASFQPSFIVDQVVATCRFMGQPLHFETKYIDYAISNLKVHRSSSPQATAATSGH
jgi:hypothetical protein